MQYSNYPDKIGLDKESQEEAKMDVKEALQEVLDSISRYEEIEPEKAVGLPSKEMVIKVLNLCGMTTEDIKDLPTPQFMQRAKEKIEKKLAKL